MSHAYCIMTKEKDIYGTQVSNIFTDLDTSPLSTQQLRHKVADAIAFLESQGIRDWEILEAWSDIMWKAGNREATKALENAALEVKKCDKS